MKKSILDSIKESVEQLHWSSETKKQKAKDLCIYIYNLYINDGGDFYQYRSLSDKYFSTVIKTKSYVKEIKDNLINNSILEVNHSYNVLGGKGKGYRFTNNIIINSDSYHICYPKQNTLINTELALFTPKEELYLSMDKLTFIDDVNNYINNFKINPIDILINEEITDQYVKVVFERDSYRYKLENALALAKESNQTLIMYKDKCYLDEVETFIKRKESDLKLIYKKNIFDLTNKCYRLSRNETNNRLDYNLTNMKAELLSYLRFDGEELVELDIANAQFAILSYVAEGLDDNFIELSRSGELYNYIATHLNITPKQAKNKMFRVAFDKVKEEQDDIRNIFPKTMLFIDEYKRKTGYKSISNLLQVKESEIMIDGLFKFIMSKGYEVFPIHDALRVKESQSKEIVLLINEYFKCINFKCMVRQKGIKQEIVQPKEDIREISYKYKGWKDVNLEISKEDIKKFNEGLIYLKENNYPIMEDTIKVINMDIYKRYFLYEKWLLKNKIEDNV